MATTTYLSIEIPDVGGDNNTWGTISNAAWNSFDACLRPTGNGTSVGLNVGAGNTLTVAGTFAAGSATAFAMPATATAGGSVVVTLAGTQTLTNKTLTSPTITGASLTGYPDATKGYSVSDVYSIGTVAGAGTVAVDVSTESSFQTATVSGSTSTLTITGPSGKAVRGALFISNTSGGNHTMTFGSGVYAVGAITTLLVDSGKKACISFIWDGTQAWVTDNYFDAVSSIYPPQSSSASLPT